MADTDTPASEQQEEKLEQTVTIDDIGPARKKITIEIPQSRIEDAIGDSYERLRDDAVVPGFRRGRTPQRLIEKRFGSAVRDDVRGQIISESYSQAIEENEIRVIGEPDVKDFDEIELPEEGSLTVEIEVEVSPNVELPAFEDIEVEKTVVEFTDEDVKKEIEHFQERYGGYESFPDEKVKEDDFLEAAVVITGEDQDEPITELEQANIWVPGKSRDFKGHVAGIVIENLGKELVGKKVGDAVTVSMTGPESHENEAIKGKPITIKMAIGTIQRLKPATIEQVVEQTGVADEAELNTRIREMLEQRAEREQQALMHEQITDYLTDKVEMELPEGLTGRQSERVLHRKQMDMLYRGSTPEEIEAALADMRAESEEESAKSLKQFFVLDAAAEKLEIEVDHAEINGRVHMIATQQGRRPEKVRQEMAKRGELEHLYLQIRESKTLDAILGKAKIKESKKSKKEADEEKKAKASKKKASKKKASKKKASKKKTDD